ncbi:hypothetical protein [Labrenzia sp. OB1]|uniref:hypothetical protein n=1 Tax=Labrenzia sp. OB1 TaxID=1561204 RepID=UPI0007B21EC2|nr:hypothetical protein [Labrenzia sp. OB1]KZM47599.1 hypothetical protein OA90_24890 [Labrenzia sp. OB1]
MQISKQKQWVADIVESLPSIAFILLWRQGGDLEMAGWAGSALALGAFMVFGILKLRMHPVLLGVNLHILLATPLVVGVYRFGDETIADFLSVNAYGSVLLTVLFAGVVQTVFSKSGFVGIADMPAHLQRRYSFLMLFISALGAAWALSDPGTGFVPVLATLTLLIGGRRFLLARWSDRNGLQGEAIVAGFSTREPYAADVSA